MPHSENLGSFLDESKNLLKEYLNVRIELAKLKFIRLFSKLAGHLVWLIIVLFLLWLFIVFLGLVMGFWLSSVVGSYAAGFGIAALIILAFNILLAWWGKNLFVNATIRTIIRHSTAETEIV